MGSDSDPETNASVDVKTGDRDAESSKLDLVVEMSSNGDMSGDLRNAGEAITRLGLELACISEKLINLSVLMMRVATKESDFEAFASAEGQILVDPMKALEFVLLSGILGSEVTELDRFASALQTEINELGEVLSSCKHAGETFKAMEEKLHDSEKSLRQSQDLISEIREQYAKFQRTLLCLDRRESWNNDMGPNFLEEDQFLNMNAKISMQTAEQQRHILMMLEKSLAREIDLEKKLTESRQAEEQLKNRLLFLEQEVFFTEEETIDVYEKCFAAENAVVALIGISRELLSRLQIFQFNLNGSAQREAALRSKLEISMEQLETKENALQIFNSSNVEFSDSLVAQIDKLKSNLKEAEDKLILASSESFTLMEKVSLLKKQLKESQFQLLNVQLSKDGSKKQDTALHPEINEMENASDVLKEKLSDAEIRAENAEAKYKLLAETNTELNEELGHLKGISEKVDSLEWQLKDADIRLQNAVATSEAYQEKQNMLYSTIRDMENLIEGLKSKVAKAERRADSAEDKCIILSESNAELNEELGFLRSRLESLESSLTQAEETKIATAKDIGFRTKVITDLVLQLAIERERLHNQISLLMLENKTLAVKLQQTGQDPSMIINHHKHDVTQVSATGSELDKTRESTSVAETKMPPADSVSELESVRRIDAGLLNFKKVLIPVLVLLISVAVYFCQPLIRSS